MSPQSDLHDELVFTCKWSLFAKKGNWLRGTQQEVLSQCDRFSFKEALRDGDVAIYISVRVAGRDDTPWYWINLDVEDPQNHGKIQSNIQVAQSLFLSLEEERLTDELQIALTGKGFRFSWPFLISKQDKRAFEAWMNEVSCIDPAPFKNGMPVRLICYRGSKHQDPEPKNVHVHFLEHPGQVLDLDELRYKRLVRGKPNPDLCMVWLRNLLPFKEAPEHWLNLLRIYHAKLRFSDCIIEPKFTFENRKKATVNWRQITEYIEANHAAREFQIGDRTIWKLSTCPACGKSEGSPYVTETGWLKCFRATCEASLSDGGLPPSKWVPDYEPLEEALDEQEKPVISLRDARELIARGIRSSENTIVRVTPGVGKTHTTLEEIAKYFSEHKAG